MYCRLEFLLKTYKHDISPTIQPYYSKIKQLKLKFPKRQEKAKKPKISAKNRTINSVNVEKFGKLNERRWILCLKTKTLNSLLFVDLQ